MVDTSEEADDATWILTSAFVILTMQSGFGLLETGMVSSKNNVNVMMKNVADVIAGGLAFWMFGFGVAFGKPSNGFTGLGDFFATATEIEAAGPKYSRYIFQFSFAATATTIVSGCVAGRIKFSAYLCFSFINIALYAFPAHWVWGDDGWLVRLGVHDFAGCGPVHLLGATNGLAGMYVLGPRTGRFEPGGAERYAMSSPISVIFGLFMLWWGWMGFNCGSTFGISGTKWIVAARVAVTTTNASCAAGMCAALYSAWSTKGRYHVDIIVNGVLGGLVGITAGCAVVSPSEAIAIGAIGGGVAVGGAKVTAWLLLDDPCGAFAVHGFGGMWGLLAVGLFADGSLPGVEIDDGVFRGGDGRLLGFQCLAIVVICAWGFGGSWLVFKALGLFGPIRASALEEERGADYTEHCVGYDDVDRSQVITQGRPAGPNAIGCSQCSTSWGSGLSSHSSPSPRGAPSRPAILAPSARRKSSLGEWLWFGRRGRRGAARGAVRCGGALGAAASSRSRRSSPSAPGAAGGASHDSHDERSGPRLCPRPVELAALRIQSRYRGQLSRKAQRKANSAPPPGVTGAQQQQPTSPWTRHSGGSERHSGGIYGLRTSGSSPKRPIPALSDRKILEQIDALRRDFERSVAALEARVRAAHGGGRADAQPDAQPQEVKVAGAGASLLA